MRILDGLGKYGFPILLLCFGIGGEGRADEEEIGRETLCGCVDDCAYEFYLAVYFGSEDCEGFAC